MLCFTKMKNTINGVVFDFDGVFTDNTVYVFDDGREAVRCSRADGLGISLLKEQGLKICVISTEENPIVSIRCMKLGINCFQGIGDKLSVLEQWAKDNNLALSQIMFVGNDSNDTTCLKSVGFPIVVADAHESVRPYAKKILSSKGGEGVAREIAGMLLSKK